MHYEAKSRNLQRLLVPATIIMMLLAFVMPKDVHATGLYDTEQLTSGQSVRNLQGDNGRLIWIAGGSSLHYFDGFVDRVISEDASSILYDFPAIHGDYIAWVKQDNITSPKIFLHRISSGQTMQISSDNDHLIEGLKIDGDNLVWTAYSQSGSESSSIKIHNIATQSTENITANLASQFEVGPENRRPSISGARVAWVNSNGSGSSEIYTKDLFSGSISRLTFNNYMDTDPQVSSNYVAWASYQSGWYGTLSLNDGISNEIVNISGTRVDNFELAGDKLVWESTPINEDAYQVNIKTLSTGSVEIYQGGVFPGTDGFHVAWLKNNYVSGDYAGSTLYALESDGSISNVASGRFLFASGRAPVVSSGLYAWFDRDGGNIHTAKKNNDINPPVLGQIQYSANPKALVQTSTMSVSVTDDLAGVAGGEYFIDNDPGAGSGIPMVLSGGILSTTFGTNMAAGVYAIGIRAQDGVGNWSSIAQSMLVVFDPAGKGINGKSKKDLVPSLANGDYLPGLNSAAQTDMAEYGLTVEYKNGVLNPHNDFLFTYNVGKQCNNLTTGCSTFKVSATSFDWLIVDQTNGSRGQFQGTAAVTVDGSLSTNPFKVTGIDGDLLDLPDQDSFSLEIFAPGANVASDSPIYKISGQVGKGNGIALR